MRLLLAKSAVGAANGLQEVMVLHGLVEVHDLQNGRVEAGEQFTGDNDELQRVGRVAEASEQLLLRVLIADVLLPLRWSSERSSEGTLFSISWARCFRC